jgi:hypothetical protein
MEATKIFLPQILLLERYSHFLALHLRFHHSPFQLWGLSWSFPQVPKTVFSSQPISLKIHAGSPGFIPLPHCFLNGRFHSCQRGVGLQLCLLGVAFRLECDLLLGWEGEGGFFGGLASFLLGGDLAPPRFRTFSWLVCLRSKEEDCCKQRILRIVIAQAFQCRDLDRYSGGQRRKIGEQVPIACCLLNAIAQCGGVSRSVYWRQNMEIRMQVAKKGLLLECDVAPGALPRVLEVTLLRTKKKTR